MKLQIDLHKTLGYIPENTNLVETTSIEIRYPYFRNKRFRQSINKDLASVKEFSKIFRVIGSITGNRCIDQKVLKVNKSSKIPYFILYCAKVVHIIFFVDGYLL